MENSQVLILRYLNDALGAEKAHQKMLDEVIEQLDGSPVLELLRRETDRSHQQEEALEACIRARGEEPSSGRNILGRAAEVLASLRHGDLGCEAATVALEKDFGAASLKIGLYRTLESYAALAGDGDVARVAQEHMAQEREAVSRAWSLMPQAAWDALRVSREMEAAEAATPNGVPTGIPADLPRPRDGDEGGAPWMSRLDAPPADLGPLSVGPRDGIDDSDFWELRPEEASNDGEDRVCDLMTPTVGTIGPEATLQEAAQKMRDLDVGPLPVCEGERVVGMITDRDLAVRAVAMGSDPRTTRVREVMTREVVCASEGDRLVHAAELMEKMQVRRIPVVDRDQRILGILSLGDVAVRQGNDHLSAEVLRHVSEPGTGHQLTVC